MMIIFVTTIVIIMSVLASIMQQKAANILDNILNNDKTDKTYKYRHNLYVYRLIVFEVDDDDIKIAKNISLVTDFKEKLVDTIIIRNNIYKIMFVDSTFIKLKFIDHTRSFNRNSVWNAIKPYSVIHTIAFKTTII
jgi:hypothetical protein